MLQRKHRTRMVKNGTNYSLTVPLPLVQEAQKVGKAQKGSAWQWTDDMVKSHLSLIAFSGTLEAAKERANKDGDVVFLQEMSRKGGKNSQYKVNLPKWIMDEVGLDLDQNALIEMTWDISGEGDISGNIPLSSLNPQKEESGGGEDGNVENGDVPVDSGQIIQAA